MSDSKTYPVMLFLIIGAMILLAFLALTVVDFANHSQSQHQILGEVPEFSFVNQYNQPYDLTKIQGKLTIINFMFTRCKSICPITSDNLYKLYKFYSHSDKLQIISITVDPENDSIAQLARYADSLGVNDSRWMFLRTEIDDVVEFSEKGLMLGADDLPGGHTTRFVLVDHLGHIRSYHDGLDDGQIKLLKYNIRTLAGELP